MEDSRPVRAHSTVHNIEHSLHRAHSTEHYPHRKQHILALRRHTEKRTEAKEQRPSSLDALQQQHASHNTDKKIAPFPSELLLVATWNSLHTGYQVIWQGVMKRYKQALPTAALIIVQGSENNISKTIWQRNKIPTGYSSPQAASGKETSK